MSEVLDALVIGAGSAGLGVSYFLKRQRRDHQVLDRSRIGETWRTQRWDSFRLNSPTIRSILPGDSYEGPEPWGAITHHEFVTYLEGYAERHCLPVSTQSPVQELTRDNGIFRVTTARGALLARNVVIATGDQNRQVRPPGSADLPAAVRQIDSSAYRNAAELENGAVLVVGSGQSGGQIAEDLALAGRVVFLATSRNGRWVRRYRGGNILSWLTLSGFLDVPRKELVLPSGKVQARALVGATHTISLQSLSAQGVVLLGRFRGIQNGSLVFGDELDDHMRFADEVSANAKRVIDEYVERAGLDAPPAEDDPAETVEPRLPDPPIRSIDWTASGIRSVVWCTGFTGDFSWVRLPGSLDAAGQPVHADGVGAIPGLFFAGLDFGSTRKSGTIPAIAEEAARLVERLAKSGADLPRNDT
ncbi:MULTISPECIES: NAD(P)/FAD-dependent oxidoreductase [unclassified Mesorhizobium]|uniref:flavin-containing monooxygenase n=1 Tax=unclassified Mesorhizobium TaxID=325217 RepID=UPI000FDA3F15|nr:MULTISPECIES: NAD(P)/FAD-dependent oxidoreductase [unclassified Mesorhizobium]TGQ34967.1 FAD-dependent oxidoreductase [Mesorhizobium sp. M00.F.Ca.ET.216.01.1.1]TIS53856.1 MAG: FAD-dependent oxidoreductase [Mesorhizobium sp.]TIS86542.1 MAG: FAD-dependent oxidoreductase [Mesorhizobium sp.]TJW09130.1 MAG: FAD-dependent oxidoreductase [Mesorhizobium sp.]TJW41794.1 MAG: FAD-dependent oxidoreductase [Mesorhizobium sp.]